MTPETGVLPGTMERSPWRSKLALLVSPTLPRSARSSRPRTRDENSSPIELNLQLSFHRSNSKRPNESTVGVRGYLHTIRKCRHFATKSYNGVECGGIYARCRAMGVGCVKVHCLLVLILATPRSPNVSIDKPTSIPAQEQWIDLHN